METLCTTILLNKAWLDFFKSTEPNYSNSFKQIEEGLYMGRYKGTEHVVSKGEFLVLLIQFQGDCWEASLLSKALIYEESLHRTAEDKTMNKCHG